MKECKIYFPSFNREIYALPGTSLFECASRAGILVRTPCAGLGKCGKCAVRIIEGEVTPSKECRNHFSQAMLDDGWRLSCRSNVVGDLVIEVPTTSLFESGVITLSDEGTERSGDVINTVPMVAKTALTLTESTLDNPVSDIDNLLAALGEPELIVALPLAKRLPAIIRENKFKVIAFTSNSHVVSVEPQADSETESANLALAVDLGTTTVALSLLDACSGKQLASAGVLNPQVSFGDDVLNRVCAQSESDAKRKEMSACVVTAINKMLAEIAGNTGIDTRGIRAVTIAGNTVMQSLFCGVPARWLGEIPFAPPFSGEMRFSASELNLATHPNAVVSLFPVIGGFVGGDITAGLLATGFATAEHDAKSLFVDVGTNGEIVLRNGDRYFATAAAAGPAFEGAGIEFGMRASNGAMEKILIEDGIIKFNVIGNEKPRGICGTALIDITAEMLKNGLMDETGRILSPDECGPDVPEALKKHLIQADNGDTYDFMITPPGTEDIFIRQKDVRQLQLASGAIRAAIAILLRKADIEAEELDSVKIAGGFGNYIRRTHAKRIGMIPDLPDDRIHFIGNTSLIGAKLALLDRAGMRRAAKIAEMVECVDVSLDPEFQMEFGMSMIFPI